MGDKDKEEYLIKLPRPFSELVWKTILHESKNPGRLCLSLDEFEKFKTKELIENIKMKDWNSTSRLLNELKTVERFKWICKNFPKG